MSSFEKPAISILIRPIMITIIISMLVIGIVNTAKPAFAYSILCSGRSYSACTNKGYTDHGYGSHNQNSYWGAYPGHNCTNYVAYVETQNGVPRPSFHLGDAYQWWSEAQGHVTESTTTPVVGSVAWWGKNQGGVSSDGHVAYVEAVSGNAGSYTITISEDSYPIGPFDWMKITQGDSRWPGGFIYFDGSSTSSASSPATVQYNSELDVFYTDSSGYVEKDTWNGSSWSRFGQLGGNGILAGTPAAVQYNSELDVFSLDINGNVEKDTWNGSSWGGFGSLGGNNGNVRLVNLPVALQFNEGSYHELDVFALDSNGNVEKDTWNGSSWSGFGSLGGNNGSVQLVNSPATVQYNSELDVFALDNNGNVEKDTWNGSSWGGFGSLGGNNGHVKLVNSPTAMQLNEGSYHELDVFVLDSAGYVEKDDWNGSSWGGFTQQGGNGVLINSPKAIQYNSEMDVFSLDMNGNVEKDTWNGSSWGGFGSLGGNNGSVKLVNSPTALQFDEGSYHELDVFSVNTSGKIEKDTWNGSSWGGFGQL